MLDALVLVGQVVELEDIENSQEGLKGLAADNDALGLQELRHIAAVACSSFRIHDLGAGAAHRDHRRTGPHLVLVGQALFALVLLLLLLQKFHIEMHARFDMADGSLTEVATLEELPTGP